MFNKKGKNISFSYNTSTFYGFPKIHKSKLIQNPIKEQQEYIHIFEPSYLKLSNSSQPYLSDKAIE